MNKIEFDISKLWQVENDLDVIDDEVKMHIFNTLSRKKQVFESIDDKKVLMYSCGPTVYSDAHIWNLRSYIFPDILKKTLRKIGYEVKHIINITDVWHLTDDASEWDDKMELMAQKKWENVWDISKKYTSKYIDDLNRLNIEMPNNFTKATDYIWAQIEMIEWLEKKWYTYNTSDWIYFDTSKFSSYCEFAHLDKENLRKWERVDFWEKRNSTDFALWKFSPNDWTKRQMEWDSPWWVWFPWWHIECSAMIWKELWSKIDIHTWWTDHIPVHHTNEIAQADCFHWSKTINYWMHWEFLVLDKNKRIWKSQWNSITLSTLLDNWFSPLSYRYLVLTAHYRSFLTFSFDALEQSEKSLKNLKSKIFKIYNNIDSWEDKISNDAKKFLITILNYFLDDLNTSMALVWIRNVIDSDNLTNFEKMFIVNYFDDILWLNLLNFSEFNNDEIPFEVKEQAEKRWLFKKEKNFLEADNIRIELEKLGYIILDEKDSYKIIRK